MWIVVALGFGWCCLLVGIHRLTADSFYEQLDVESEGALAKFLC